MKMAFFVLIATFFLLSCDTDQFLPTEDRPGIPIPSGYSSSVDAESEKMVIETATIDYFNPIVTDSWDANGDLLFSEGTSRILLVEDGEIGATPTSGPGLSSIPSLQFVRYWRLLGEAEPYAGGAEVTVTESTTRGQTSTQTFSFSETLKSETNAEVKFFVSASVTLSASFTATQEFTSTTTTEETVSYSFTVSPQVDKNVVYTTWQLIEEYRYVDADGMLFDDSKYDFEENSIRFVFPTDEIVPVTTYFANN